jgi:hypothetical protein
MPAADRDAAAGKLAAAVQAAQAAIARLPGRHERVRGYGELLAALAEQTLAVTAERDRELIELLGQQPRPSNRALAEELGMSRQRVDQLARHVRAGGRPRRDR